MTATVDRGVNPITLEVIRNALPAISNEMSADLQRASYNMMIYEVRDYSCGIVAPNGDLISQHVGGVSHFVADLGVIIEDAIKRYGYGGLHPDDVLITNHQAVAGQHLNNVVVYVPAFVNEQLACFSMVRAHWVDVGGLSTGFGAHSAVSDPWMEGLQLNQLKIEDAGQPNETLYQLLRDNIRFPDAALGDLRSQIAACRLGVRRVQELYARYGAAVVESSIQQIFDETEQRCRRVVATIPDGEYEASSFLDHDGIPADGRVDIHARVVVSGEEMIIDLSKCSPQRRAAMNGRTLAAAMIAYKCLTTPEEPMNQGALRAVTVVIPEGNLMMAKFPAPMSGWSLVLPTAVDTILAALAPAIPDRIPAAHFGVLGGAVIFVGEKPDTHERFVVQSLEGGGWGGRPTGDGPSASLSVCQGDVRNAPIESIELRCPVVVESRSLRTDSGGPGRYRGGLGLDTTVRNLVSGSWNGFMAPRIGCPAWGLSGGRPGDRGGYLVRHTGDAEFRYEDIVLYGVEVGARVTTRTGGGGGWGDPRERDLEHVRHDVAEGLVSVAAARSEYGVVIDPQTLTVDVAATHRLRSGPSAAQRRTRLQKNDAARLAAVDAVVSELGCERLLAVFSGVPNFLAPNPVLLLTGFRSLGASAVACAPGGARMLAVTPRWDEQRAREQVADEVPVVGVGTLVDAIDGLIGGARSVAVVGLDDADERLRAAIEDTGVTLVDAEQALFDRTRAKTEAEIARALRATEIAEQAYARLLETLQVGVAEYELAAELDASIARAGGEDNFLLLSSGPTGGPVRQPTARRLRRRDVIGLELSPCVEGQFVQICRTVVIGPASDAQREDYALLVRALQSGVAAARPGATAASVTEAVNRPLVQDGYGDYCRPPYMRVRGHGLGGSGVAPGGLTSTNETVLEPSMLFVLHPNQHLPRSGYMLCGDPVVITPTGAEVLTSRPPALDEVV